MKDQRALVPFDAALELDHSLGDWKSEDRDDDPSLPGQPRLYLSDLNSLVIFLSRDLLCHDLDRLSPYLWLISTPNPANITPLHLQRLRGRHVVPMEDPDLHLVWRRHEIYIKPLPQYLLSHSFWSNVLLHGDEDHRSIKLGIVRAALGLLRTYSLLVQHASDFNIAQRDDLHLIPKSITYEDFCRFIAAFEHFDATEVSDRYGRYGEVRYSRLSNLVKILLIRWSYRDTTSDYRDYLERFLGPLLFIFAIFSVILNAMQVALAVESLDPTPWMAFRELARWFAISTMVVAVLLVGSLTLLLFKKVLEEISYTVKKRLSRAR